MLNPNALHYKALDRIQKYLVNTINYKLIFRANNIISKNSTNNKLETINPFNLIRYVDAN